MLNAASLLLAPGSDPTARPLPSAGLAGRAADFEAAPLLGTRRLLLRGLAYRDALDLLRLDREARVQELLLDAHVGSLAEVAQLIAWINRLYVERPGLGAWHAALRGPDGSTPAEFIGVFSLMPIQDSEDVEIGARLLPSAWGRGLALEAGEALCHYAFDRLQLQRLTGLCHPDNRSVPPLLRRLGFIDAGGCEHFGKPALRLELARDNWQGRRPRPGRRC